MIQIEDDEAFMFSLIASSHLQIHKNQLPDPNCQFCNAMLIDHNNGKEPLENHEVIIFDVSN